MTLVIRNTDEMQRDEHGTMVKVRASLGATSLGMQIEEFPPNSQEDFYPQHNHEQEGLEEVYYCLEGSGEVQVNDGSWEKFTQGAFIKIDPEDTRMFKSGENGLKLLATAGSTKGQYSPPSWTELQSSESAPHGTTGRQGDESEQGSGSTQGS